MLYKNSEPLKKKKGQIMFRTLYLRQEWVYSD